MLQEHRDGTIRGQRYSDWSIVVAHLYQLDKNLIVHATAKPLRTVLSVEDDAANAQLVEQLIERRGDLKLLAARSGHEGVDMARANLPDVILMDINLPDINGLEAMKILRQDGAAAHIPVIGLSSNAFPRQIEDGVRAGFFLYMTKPYKLAALLAAIDAALAAAKNRDL